MKIKDIGTDFNYVLIPAYADLVCDDMPERIRDLRFDALKKLQARLTQYQKRGILPRLIYAVAEKKCKMIMEATTKKEMVEILGLPCPRYDGNKFITGKYHVLEEELICWSVVSSDGLKLNQPGCERYVEVFRQVFPEEERKIISITKKRWEGDSIA